MNRLFEYNTGFTTTGKSIVDSLMLCDGESRFEAEIYYLYKYFVDNTGFNKTGESCRFIDAVQKVIKSF